jgi:hypothetical protein
MRASSACRATSASSTRWCGRSNRHADDALARGTAVAAVEDLEDHATCSDGAALRLTPREPTDPELRQRVAATQAHLDDGLAQHRLGHDREALVLARDARVAAAEIGYAPLLARALYVGGPHRRRARRSRRGRGRISRPPWRWPPPRSPRARAPRIGELLLAQLTRDPARAAGAFAVLDLAKEAAERAPRRPNRRARISCTEGALRLRAGRPDEGIRENRALRLRAGGGARAAQLRRRLGAGPPGRGVARARARRGAAARGRTRRRDPLAALTVSARPTSQI